MTTHFVVCYELTPARGESPEAKALDITLEQTVELPREALATEQAERMVGRLDALEPAGRRRWRAEIAFPLAAVGGELTQFLNVLFGNSSLKRGIRIVDIRWPAALLADFGGPGHGIAGLRRLTSVTDRALLATALKPMGLTAAQLAHRCREFATGGIDIVKDDHGLADQEPARFNERLARCQEAVTAVNARQGGHSLYFPNVTAAWPRMMERVELARKAGCRGVLINPWATGLDAMRWIRDSYGLAVMAHPALTGAYFNAHHGIAAGVLLGDVFRIAGADAVIYPNVGGRFGFSRRLCENINERLRRPLGALAGSFPTPGGGVDVDRAAYWARRYGPDTIFLIGSSLYLRGELAAASRRLRATIEGA